MPEVKRYLKTGLILKAKYLIDMTPENKLGRSFFIRDALQVAPDLLGKNLVIRSGINFFQKYKITETEAYIGLDDKACHASKGRTARTEVMFHEGGKIYVYLVYGMYWMLNFVTGPAESPQAVLIRGLDKYSGPGKLTRALGIDKSYYGEDLFSSDRIWVEDNDCVPRIRSGKRIGVDYAGDEWSNKPWRYYIESSGSRKY